MKALSKLRSSAVIHFNLSHSIINDATIRRIGSNLKEVGKIADKHSHNKRIEFSDIGVIYRKFLLIAPLGEEKLKAEFCTKREIRKLTNSITYHDNDQLAILESGHFDLALKLISQSFSRSILNSLFITILEKWEHPNIQKIINLINQKRSDLKSKSRINDTLGLHSKYFLNKTAHQELYKDIVRDDIKLIEICNFLKIHESCIRYQYFSVFIELYTNLKIKANQVDGTLNEIFKFLEIHNNIETNKKCMTKIIIFAEDNDFTENKKMHVLNFCFSNIGDPSIDIKWLPWLYSTAKDKEDVKRAQQLMNQWLAHKFIYLFFGKIAMDNNRKDFWMQYLKHISNFKIFMESYDREMFFSRNRDIDAKLLQSKIGILEKSGNSSAFILQIKDYILVEFSQTGGACYIYRNSNKYKPNINKSKYQLSELKQVSNRELAVKVDVNSSWYYSSDFSTHEEGRVMHSGEWQRKFEHWIRIYLDIEV